MRISVPDGESISATLECVRIGQVCVPLSSHPGPSAPTKIGLTAKTESGAKLGATYCGRSPRFS
jgi:hypothetical protein